MKKLIWVLLSFIWVLTTSSLFAAGGGGGGSGNGGGSASRPTVTAKDPYPTTAQDYYRSGYSAAKAGKFPEAIQDFRVALTMKSDYPEALNMMGYSLRKTGKTDEAFSYYEKALNLRPDFPDAREYYGEAYLQSGDLKNALQQYVLLQKAGARQAKDLLAFIDAYVNDKPMPEEDI